MLHADDRGSFDDEGSWEDDSAAYHPWRFDLADIDERNRAAAHAWIKTCI